jgi:hypothetical protein
MPSINSKNDSNCCNCCYCWFSSSRQELLHVGQAVFVTKFLGCKGLIGCLGAPGFKSHFVRQTNWRTTLFSFTEAVVLSVSKSGAARTTTLATDHSHWHLNCRSLGSCTLCRWCKLPLGIEHQHLAWLWYQSSTSMHHSTYPGP